MSTLKPCPKTQGTWPSRVPFAPYNAENQVRISFSDRVGDQTHLVMHGADMCDRGTHDQRSIAQFDQKKIFAHGFLHSRAQRESKGSSPMNGSAWIHTSRHAHLQTSLIYAHMYTILTLYKTLHLAQTDQARLMRFFALPDSNTSPRIAISVLPVFGGMRQ